MNIGIENMYCNILSILSNDNNTLQALELTPFFSAKKHAKTHSEDHMYMHSWSFHYYIDVMDTSIRDVFLGIAALTRQPDVPDT